MPAKGRGLLVGNRYNPLNKELYNKFIEVHGNIVDFKTFLNIIRTTNDIIREAVTEEAGVKLPERLGYLIVTKYKSSRTGTDWINSIKYKRHIPLLNLHSFGYIYHIRWFSRIGVHCANIAAFKFYPYRILKRAIAKKVKEGKKYFKWQNSDLWSTTLLERRFDRFYKKQQT